MDPQELENIVKLGPRVPVGRRGGIGTMDGSIIQIAVPDRVIEARSAATTVSSSAAATSTNCGDAACEKPTSSATFTLPIVLGIVIPVVGAAITFFILQRRHSRKQREEDANDRHASMDFGLGDVPQPGHKYRVPNRGASRGPSPAGGMAEAPFDEEKSGMSKRQISMDMSRHNNPYLLPPELQNSRESLHSLSRTMEQEDPYRPVKEYYPGDGASVRSQSKQGSSIYTGSSQAPSRLQEMGTADLLGHAGPMPRSTPPSTAGGAFVPPPRQNSLPPNHSSMSPTETSPTSTLAPYPVELPAAYMPEAPQVTRKSLPTANPNFPSSPRPGNAINPKPLAPGLQPSAAVMGDVRDENKRDTKDLRASNNYLSNLIIDREPSPAPEEVSRQPAPAPLYALPANPRPVRKESMPVNVHVDEESDYGDGFKVTPPSPGREHMRGQRYSMDVPPEQFAQAGLGAPGFDPKRLSMGFRPLPPDAINETDDPELRANRIRSFYKEYFDESKPAPKGQYYEDYDENYLGEAAYFDPETNAFVMPYAEPVTRRAMTPPPRAGPRFQGQGPPRGRQGSMGAMSVGGGGYGPARPRQGSMGAQSAGGYGGPGMRGPPGPRAYSSASGRMGPPGKPKKPMPPPEALTTLPTPSKLRDDTFALNPIDFAPPTTYRDRVAGRSESPLGERRPYSPAVPAFAPVVSAFDELAPMPSPHMLRKSGTFTSLDFAPPKKFRDADNMSDAGSIRSNRSGISAVQLGAIRNGAYRVSKLPDDVVFTKDALATTLKPQWGMRPGQ